MRKWFAILWFASACTLIFAQAGPVVTKAYSDNGGRLHIITADGRDHTIKPANWQSGGGFEDVAVAPDRRTVGWLVNQMLTPLEGSTNYSYPVAIELDIWRGGRVVQRFSPPAYTIQDWIFLKSGSEVALHVAPPHGQEFYDCTIFDVNTGKKLAHWSLDRRDYVVPDWAKPLLAGDTLPGADEISNWFPDVPAAAQKTPQPQQK
jgi:hypothetical protein